MPRRRRNLTSSTSYTSRCVIPFWSTLGLSIGIAVVLAQTQCCKAFVIPSAFTSSIPNAPSRRPLEFWQGDDVGKERTRPLYTKNDNDSISREGLSRREALLLSSAVLLPFALSSPSKAIDSTLTASAVTSENPLESLEDLLLGSGKWVQASQFTMSEREIVVPATFAAYICRFLIRYDRGVSLWWTSTEKSNSLLPDEQKQAQLGRSFGGLARSVQMALNTYILQSEDIRTRYADLAKLFLETYCVDEEARRQIAVLFATLPSAQQPTAFLEKLATSRTTASSETSRLSPPTILVEDFSALLPAGFTCANVKGTQRFTIDPPINLFEVGLDEEFGQTATATAFGPLSSSPLKRERPNYSFDIYKAFAVSGAAGCALTHSVVIPLDVVKTRMQTDPGDSNNMWQGATSIVQNEGISGLLLGAQATVVGYIWYGLSVYPCYTFFKRFIGQAVLSPEFATVHLNGIALAAGALASVVASIGLTPLECCRIRAVADPEKYRPMGLVGTAKEVASENPDLGWKNLYGGFPSLVTRQVIFGSVKFLAFERACEAIFSTWPALHDATWTSLAVSLVAGGFSGTLSSIVSQPADSVLTYVAQNSGGEASLGILEGVSVMIDREGAGSLFRGLGSRCVWAGSIIAGQFLLYDVFRTYFGVTSDDLSQVFQVVISTQNIA